MESALNLQARLSQSQSAPWSPQQTFWRPQAGSIFAESSLGKENEINMEEDSLCYPEKAANEAERMAEVSKEWESVPTITSGADSVKARGSVNIVEACRPGAALHLERSEDVIHSERVSLTGLLLEWRSRVSTNKNINDWNRTFYEVMSKIHNYLQLLGGHLNKRGVI